MNKYVSFDIETYGSVENPEGITCAATLTDDGDLTVWKPAVGGDGRYQPKMSKDDLGYLIAYLEAQWIEHRRRPLAFNGLSFDFRVLHNHCWPSMRDTVKGLALIQIDPALHFLSEMGFMCGLQKVSMAMGASGKLTGFDGHKAAELWMTGTRTDQEMILKYVAQDVVVTREIYELIMRYGKLNWVKTSGKIGTWIPKTRTILPAQDVIERGFVGKPVWWTGDSWPWTKENVFGWIGN